MEEAPSGAPPQAASPEAHSSARNQRKRLPLETPRQYRRSARRSASLRRRANKGIRVRSPEASIAAPYSFIGCRNPPCQILHVNHRTPKLNPEASKLFKLASTHRDIISARHPGASLVIVEQQTALGFASIQFPITVRQQSHSSIRSKPLFGLLALLCDFQIFGQR